MSIGKRDRSQKKLEYGHGDLSFQSLEIPQNCPTDWDHLRVFRVIPHEDESLGHFLGRFRRANELSHRAITDHLGIRVEWVQAWESPSRRRNPTPLQLLALSKLVDVEPEQLTKMLPPINLHLQTRLCGTCYTEVPIHRAI